MWCIVNLPNGTQQAVKLDPKAIGQECLEKVCKALGVICEMEYFGLEHWSPNQQESRTHQWINLRNRLSTDCSSGCGIQLMLALRVKFWVPIHFVLQESARNLFYMQAKVDLLEGRLKAHDWSNAAKLAALLCQAEGIRFNGASLKCECPLKIRKELEKLKQQTLQHQQQHHYHHQQQQQHQQHSHYKICKDKDHVLSFKKRRLSKPKSVENIDHIHCQPSNACSSRVHQHCLPEIETVGNSSNCSNSLPNKIVTDKFNTSLKTSDAVSASTSLPPFCNVPCSTFANFGYDTERAEHLIMSSPLRIYQNHLVRPINSDNDCNLPEDFLRQIAIEHGKLATLKMSQKSAKYWLLQEIQDLPGYGEEVFSGFTTGEHSVRCDIAVAAYGITITQGKNVNNIPFSAIAAAKSFRRTFKLEYVDDRNDRREIEIKLPKHAIASGLYRSITERHAFYICDKVRGVVTNQFTRDLKGTIASMFKEDTELGKRYVFDIQRTSREVHDQARRILHERGIDTSAAYGGRDLEDFAQYLPNRISFESNRYEQNKHLRSDIDNSIDSGSSSCKLELIIREKADREAAIERCVDSRISEAMTCKICMDRTINAMFNPCCHVIACDKCALRCENCPNCRVKTTSVIKIYLPPELRTHSQSSSDNESNEDISSTIYNANANDSDIRKLTTSA